MKPITQEISASSFYLFLLILFLVGIVFVGFSGKKAIKDSEADSNGLYYSIKED